MSNSSQRGYVRSQALVLAARLAEPRRFIQAVLGPRQIGKTTLVRHVVSKTGRPVHAVSADEPALRQREWLVQQWETARNLADDAGKRGAILVLDEIQKVPNWSETVKRLWDEDTSPPSAAARRSARIGSTDCSAGPHGEPGGAF